MQNERGSSFVQVGGWITPPRTSWRTLRCKLHHRLVSILGRIRQDVASLLDKDAINAACREENYTWKNRLLNPTNTVHLFILQILNRNTALNDLPRKSHASFTGSAFCKARRRLPLRVFQRLLRRLAETLLPAHGGEQGDDEGRWLGHRTFLMDGSSCSMPDTPELQRYFGQPGNQRPGCGFPVAHLLVLFHAGTGLIREILTSPLRTHDMSQVVQLHPALEPGDIGLGDRGFCSYAHLALLSLKGVFGVFRIHQRKKVQFEEPADSDAAAPRSGRLPRWLYRLGARDHVVEWIKPKQAPEWMTADQYATLPRAAGGARAALSRGTARVSGPVSDAGHDAVGRGAVSAGGVGGTVPAAVAGGASSARLENNNEHGCLEV